MTDMIAARDGIEAMADRSAALVRDWDTTSRQEIQAEVWQLYLIAHAATCATDAARSPAAQASAALVPQGRRPAGPPIDLGDDPDGDNTP